jgi:hypothetical protein
MPGDDVVLNTSGDTETNLALTGKLEGDDKPAAAAVGDDIAAAAAVVVDPAATPVAMVPDEYAQFTMPEGVTIDPEYLKSLAPALKEAGLTQEAAQTFIEAQAKLFQAQEETRVQAFDQMTQNWLNSAKADKEIGGETFDQNVQAARSALKQFGTPELNGLLQDYGIGNHPEVIRIFTRIGKLLKEDQPGNLTAPTHQKLDRADILYPQS